MQILERYIFRTALSAFLLCLGALTAVIWLTTALRELDLVTGKGQTLFKFLYLTMLSVPALIMIIAPLALFIAIMYTLNKLNGDSELIVMSAAGMQPWRILKPFLILTLAVSFLVGLITLKIMPESFRELRDLVTKIRADVVTHFVQEGKFITLEQGITFHYRDKAPNGTMRGIMFHDRRNPNFSMTYFAERGRVIEVEGTPFFVLEKGSVQRQDKAKKETALVYFERYSLDLDQLGISEGKVVYKPRERTTAELMKLKATDGGLAGQFGRYRAELHERFAQPLYAFATLAIAFAALGSARTTRQGRGTAMVAAGAAMLLLRVGGFWASTMAVRNAGGVVLMYLLPVLFVLIASLYAVWTQIRPKAMAGVVNLIETALERTGIAALARAFDPVEWLMSMAAKVRR